MDFKLLLFLFFSINLVFVNVCCVRKGSVQKRLDEGDKNKIELKTELQIRNYKTVDSVDKNKTVDSGDKTETEIKTETGDKDEKKRDYLQIFHITKNHKEKKQERNLRQPTETSILQQKIKNFDENITADDQNVLLKDLTKVDANLPSHSPTNSFLKDVDFTNFPSEDSAENNILKLLHSEDVHSGNIPSESSSSTLSEIPKNVADDVSKKISDDISNAIPNDINIPGININIKPSSAWMSRGSFFSVFAVITISIFI